jgi:hypothetical protein
LGGECPIDLLQEGEHPLMQTALPQEFVVIFPFQDKRFHSRPPSEKIGVMERYTLISVPVEDQEGDLQILHTLLGIQCAERQPCSIAPERPEDANGETPRKAFVSERSSPDLPQVRWCGNGDQSVDSWCPCHSGEDCCRSSHGVSDQNDGAIGKGSFHFAGGRQDVIPVVPDCDKGRFRGHAMVADIEEEHGISGLQERLGHHGHASVTRPPSVHEDRHGTAAIFVRLHKPPFERLAQ